MDKLKRDVRAKNIIYNPSAKELRELAKKDEQTTIFGSANYISKVRNRSAKNTYVVYEKGFKKGINQQYIDKEKALKISKEVNEYLKDKELICLDRKMGQNDFVLHCRLYITKEYARIAYMWNNMLFPPEEGREPDLVSIYVPEWPERIIFVHPDERVTYILGTDYFGEAKKSFLRMAMYEAKKRGYLGFHAGSKVLKVKDYNGNVKEVGFILFGLSGTGKTTLTIHDHGLKGDEGVIIRQDDVVVMTETGYCYGTENGFYIKTEGLDESQKVLYDAATKPHAILENVKVYDDGRVDFANTELTSNGRGVILRSDVLNTDQCIDIDRADKIIFITRRNNIVPVVAKLNPEQAAAFFMLGESIETSAGDPTKAGQSKREVGTNPFIMGPEYEEGNRFYEFVKNNPDIECYLLNTGSIGAKEDFKGEKITIGVSTEIMKQIALGNIEWTEDEDWGYLVPRYIENVDLEKYNPRRFYTKEEYRNLIEVLREERINWLKKFTGLKEEILEWIYAKEYV